MSGLFSKDAKKANKFMFFVLLLFVVVLLLRHTGTMTKYNMKNNKKETPKAIDSHK